ncbi:conserved hypothetical protein [Theileria orientalis strain Shintoku]|uniref:Uncharacterized protein n=1 Tax=Theileria orientalis strain Shintoku TaxID=869250 RepID=J4DAM2_THEOR|nr:conserved hypothetical protein [Theileria orientalis strain Shintoku]BAM42075.1 conserved hypothetical protein [Theileria orientalis strain Shintoku]|eukprot:XP_009692376.1 conserved hypothetical protein [Theileria orientalis strain Shintoku]
MDRLEFLTPFDRRLDRDYNSTTTLESGTNLSSRTFNNGYSITSNESTTGEDGQFYKVNKDFIVPNGFNSILFLPLLNAVFKPSDLKRELVVKIDLQELVKALLAAASRVDNAFTLLGNHVKGLCILLSHQIKYLSTDFLVLSKRLVGTDLAVANKMETSRYYESDDESRDKARRRQRKRKIRDTDSVTTIQEYSDKNQRYFVNLFREFSELLPVERFEMLRWMNLGLASNDFMFMNNQVSPVLKDYLKEMNISNRVSGTEFGYNLLLGDKDWLSFDDLRMLSTPFRLNGYSFTPNIDSATIAETSEVSYSSTYDIDWSLRNDPLNYKSGYYENYYNVDAIDDEFNERQVLALEDNKARKKRRSTTMKLYDVNLVRAEIKYDRRPNKYKPKRKAVERSPSVQENRVDVEQQQKQFALPQPQADTKQVTLSQMFDKYFSSLVNGDGTTGNKELRQKDVRAQMNEKENKMYETTFQETGDGFGTLDVLNWLRETFRKSDFGSINFDKLTKGLKASKASVVFLRVLILANSNFVAVSQEKETITVAPGVSGQ